MSDLPSRNAPVQPPTVREEGRAGHPPGGQARLGRQDWIRAAIDVMVASSVEQVRIEKLAVTLGVTRGSFYWHFTDRDALLAAVLDHWRERATLTIQARLARQEPSPRRRLLMFMQLPLRSPASLRAADLELAIIGWARRSPAVRHAVEAVDQARVAHLAGLFAEMGLDGGEAGMRAHQAYAFLRYVAQRRDMPLAERNDLIERLHRQLLQARAGLGPLPLGRG